MVHAKDIEVACMVEGRCQKSGSQNMKTPYMVEGKCQKIYISFQNNIKQWFYLLKGLLCLYALYLITSIRVHILSYWKLKKGGTENRATEC